MDSLKSYTIRIMLLISIISCKDKRDADNHVVISRVLHNAKVRRLIYLQVACDCPDWSDFNYFYNAYNDTILGRNIYETEFTYYIEPTRSDSIIDRNKLQPFDVVDFLSEKDTILRLLINNDFTEQAPKWKVLMYSSYKVVGKLSHGQFVQR